MTWTRPLAVAGWALVLGGPQSADAGWSSAQLEFTYDADPWFISAPTQEMANLLANGTSLGKHIDKFYPKLPKDCYDHQFSVERHNPEIPKGLKQIRFKGRKAYERQDTFSDSFHYELHIPDQVNNAYKIVVAYAHGSLCPNVLKSDFKQIAASLNPGKPELPKASVKKRSAETGGAKREAEEQDQEQTHVLRRKGARPPEARGRSETPEAERDYVRAADYLIAGNLLTADSVIDRLVDSFPGYIRPHLGRATFMKLTGRMDDFDRSLATARALDPKLEQDPPDFLCTQVQRDRKRAVQVRAKPEDPCLSISNGLIREAFGNFKGAMESYDHAISINSSLWLAYSLRGILETQLKDCVGARKDLERAVHLNPLYKPHAAYYLRQCPPEPQPERPPEPTPANPFPERAEDLELP